MTSDHLASGQWTVREGFADEFVARWREFLGWTREEHPGLDTATLIRSQSSPNSFISVASWNSAEARSDWKASDGFQERFGACRELCDDFTGGDHDRVATI